MVFHNFNCGKMVEKVEKRDGEIVDFDRQRITRAINVAFKESGEGSLDDAEELTNKAVDLLERNFKDEIPSIETIQDIVVDLLIEDNYKETAKAYILYRDRRRIPRETKSKEIESHIKLKNLSLNAIRVLARRYLLRDEEGRIIETPDGLFRRVSKAVAEVDLQHDKTQEEVKQLENSFYDLMTQQIFMPNSPTLFNAGAGNNLTLSACFVLPVEDDLGKIFETLKHMALVQKAGGGTGFAFSDIRPRGDIVQSTGGEASGPVSFMKVYDRATEAIKQGGKRRGANMGILRVDHPDIKEFIRAKREKGELTNFNISVGATDAFMEAVKKDKKYSLVNPRNGKVEEEISARDVFEFITAMAWDTGDPGMIWLDKINEDNPIIHLGRIKGTNPCGELPLLPYESCNLGHINLEKFVREGEIQWDRLEEIVALGVHFLDNVITLNTYPIPEIEEGTKKTRKIGLGVMGFANLLFQLRIPYDSDDALEIGEKIMSFIQEKATEKSKDLAEKRGVFPAWEGSIYDDEGLRLRNSTRTVIAPTGTTSMIADTSPSIEPIFAIVYQKTEILGGETLERANPYFEEVLKEEGLYSDEILSKVRKTGSLQDVEKVPDEIKRVFKTALEIEPEWHIKMQAAFQRHTRNSVSKTINMPENATIKDVSDAYMLAYDLGCKGITIFRYGSKEKQVWEIGEGIECEVC